MTLQNRKPSLKFSLSAACGAILIVASLAACSSKTIPDDSPRSDVYPDFSKPLTQAMPQMSNEDAAKQEKQLAALAARKRSGAISEAEYLRRVKELRDLNTATQAPK
jgi:hypothetical protein